jgi:hypothetical protein
MRRPTKAKTRGLKMSEQKELTEKEQREYLLSKIGHSVNFHYPEPDYPSEGILKDRYVFKESEDNTVVYWDLIDLIEFKNHNEKWLRLTYYRYKKKETKWGFAGQTSLCEPISTFQELFVNGIKERQWIRQFFKQIFKKCAKELE